MLNAPLSSRGAKKRLSLLIPLSSLLTSWSNRFWLLWGLARSLLIYYGKPGRARRDRQFYSQFIVRGALCFDIGAHAGNRVGVFLSLGARCIAIEPQPAFAALLRRLYGRHPAFALEQIALGATSGTAALHISRRTPTVSTTLAGWKERVGRSAPFARVSWDETIVTSMTTLDALIDCYGLPALCKIDVEGSELRVLQGLSRPLPLVSLEYIPAVVADAVACVERLESLDKYEYNWSRGETQKLREDRWLSADEMKNRLHSFSVDEPSGDIYARLV